MSKLLEWDVVCGPNLTLRAGSMFLPEEPELGFELNEAAVAYAHELYLEGIGIR